MVKKIYWFPTIVKTYMIRTKWVNVCELATYTSSSKCDYKWSGYYIKQWLFFKYKKDIPCIDYTIKNNVITFKKTPNKEAELVIVY